MSSCNLSAPDLVSTCTLKLSCQNCTNSRACTSDHSILLVFYAMRSNVLLPFGAPQIISSIILPLSFSSFFCNNSRLWNRCNCRYFALATWIRGYYPFKNCTNYEIQPSVPHLLTLSEHREAVESSSTSLTAPPGFPYCALRL
jgi:hypothetical protein